MYETYKLMQEIVTPASSNKNLEELCELYKKDLNPIYFATAFVKLYPMIVVSTSDKLRIECEADIVSICLEKLDMCMREYTKDKGAKFSSFFLTCYKREQYRIIGRMSNLKNPQIVDTPIDGFFNLKCVDDYNFTEDIINNMKLNKKEKQVLYLLLWGYSVLEISNMFNMTRNGIYYIIDKLKLKFNTLQSSLNSV